MKKGNIDFAYALDNRSKKLLIESVKSQGKKKNDVERKSIGFH